MLVAKVSFVLMRFIVAPCLFIAGIVFILVPIDTAIRLARGNLLSWGGHLVNILSETGESVSVGGAMLVFGVMVACPRHSAWLFGSKMPVSLIMLESLRSLTRISDRTTRRASLLKGTIRGTYKYLYMFILF